MDAPHFHVVKRDGTHQPVHFDKITERMEGVAEGLSEAIEPAEIAQQVIRDLVSGMTTRELDEFAARVCNDRILVHPDYGVMAARILASNLQKSAAPTFSGAIERLAAVTNRRTGRPAPLVAPDVLAFVRANAARLDAAIVAARDRSYDYFGFKTLERSYLLHQDNADGGANSVIETPQYMWMRVAVGIHVGDVEAAIETYDCMSRGLFTHASPTLFAAGTPNAQMSSCFLLQVREDSIEGIYDTLKDCAQISKSAGGIGLAVHKIRAKGTYIAGTNGESNGLVPMLRVFNNTARYVDQGGGKRKGAFAVYLEPWHADIEDFLDLKRQVGDHEARTHDLFTALWVPDLFMERVEADGVWSLMCPHECPGLHECHGDAFRALYEHYEAEGRHRRQVRARELYMHIARAQAESGTPYMLYKDHANRKSNHQHLGTIESSNLCTEIIEFTAPDEIAVCNLASIALPRFVDADAHTFDFEGLARVVRIAVRNLNRIIDLNHYPVEAARRSNLRHRPIGLGVQGLADAFVLMGLPFESDAAGALDVQIFETIYYAACAASIELAERDGPYETFPGSPASQGRLQFDLWGVAPSARHDWAGLKARLAAHGMRNSLLIAPMPTASTAQILGNSECTEPFNALIYERKVLAGRYVVVNQHMVRMLSARGLWTTAIKNAIVSADGSMQGIPEIPDDIKALFKTVYEISQELILRRAAARGPYIDQSQSTNVHIAAPTMAALTTLHMRAWKLGLKTGMYYLRSRPAAAALRITVRAPAPAPDTCSRDNRDCAACSS